MKSSWLIKSRHPKVILFFGGWGSEPRAFEPVSSEMYDVLMCYDYRELSNPVDVNNLFLNYDEVWLVAWSLGVWVAHEVLKGADFPFQGAVAVNGTLNPVDEHEGIVPVIFNGTLNNLSPNSLLKFNWRMLSNAEERQLFEHHAGTRTVDELKSELAFLKNCVHPTGNTLFQVALIGDEDRIFLTVNQHHYWNAKVRVVNCAVSHFPFYKAGSWDKLMNWIKDTHE
jgi:biotin synthesis protein BioG